MVLSEKLALKWCKQHAMSCLAPPNNAHWGECFASLLPASETCSHCLFCASCLCVRKEVIIVIDCNFCETLLTLCLAKIPRSVVRWWDGWSIPRNPCRCWLGWDVSLWCISINPASVDISWLSSWQLDNNAVYCMVLFDLSLFNGNFVFLAYHLW